MRGPSSRWTSWKCTVLGSTAGHRLIGKATAAKAIVPFQIDRGIGRGATRLAAPPSHRCPRPATRSAGRSDGRRSTSSLTWAPARGRRRRLRGSPPRREEWGPGKSPCLLTHPSPRPRMCGAFVRGHAGSGRLALLRAAGGAPPGRLVRAVAERLARAAAAAAQRDRLLVDGDLVAVLVGERERPAHEERAIAVGRDARLGHALATAGSCT